MLCSFSSIFFFVSENFAADHFNDDIIPFVREKDSVQYDISVALSYVKDKGKLRYKITYKIPNGKIDMIHCLKYLHFQH